MFEKFYFKIFNYVLSASRDGLVELRLPNGHGRIYGNVAEMPIVVSTSQWSFFKRALLDGGAGMGDSLSDGEWKTSQMTEFLGFLIKNKPYFNARLKFFRGILNLARPWIFFQSKKVSQRRSDTIRAHLEFGNDFSSCF